MWKKTSRSEGKAMFSTYLRNPERHRRVHKVAKNESLRTTTLKFQVNAEVQQASLDPGTKRSVDS